MKKLAYTVTHNYEFIEPPIYEGQISKLYKACENEIKRFVAVKEINMALLSNATNEIQEEVIALNKYRKFTSRTPFVCGMHIDNNEKKGYIVMEWIDGTSMRNKIEGNKNNDLLDAVNWIIDLCGILEKLHSERYQHKDLKPENIQITKSNEVYLLDMNISLKQLKRGTGTPGYMAPELTTDYEISGYEQADIFSIGVLLYELLTGICPMNQRDYYAPRNNKKWEFFREPKDINTTIPAKLNDVIVNCMMLDPRNRYRRAQDVRNELYKAKKGTIWM